MGADFLRNTLPFEQKPFFKEEEGGKTAPEKRRERKVTKIHNSLLQRGAGRRFK